MGDFQLRRREHEQILAQPVLVQQEAVAEEQMFHEPVAVEVEHREEELPMEDAWMQEQFAYRDRELNKNRNDKALKETTRTENRVQEALAIGRVREQRRKKAFKADKQKVATDKSRHKFYKAMMGFVKLGRRISGSDLEERNTMEEPTYHGMTFRDAQRTGVNGGTKPNAVQIATDGSRWLMKSNHSCIGAAAPNASKMTVAGYRVQQLVHPDTAIEAFETKKRGLGTVSMQRMADHVLDPGRNEVVDLFRFSRTPESMTEAELTEVEELSPQLLREHTTDWLLANFDTKGENFIVSQNQDGSRTLRGIDKEAGGRALFAEGAQHMSKDYQHFDQDTVYNQMFRKFADGSMRLELHGVLAQVQRVEAMNDHDYLAMFEEYVRIQKPEVREKTREALLKRKTELRVEYRRFFGELVKERMQHVSAEERAELIIKYLGGQEDGLFIFQDDTPESIREERNRELRMREANREELDRKAREADEKDEKSYKSRHALYDFSKGFVMGFKKFFGIGKIKERDEQRTFDSGGAQIQMVRHEEVRLGGTKPMSQYRDQYGGKWLTKQAVDCMGHSKPSGAILTEVGFKVQQMVEPETAVEAHVGKTVDHGLVSFQRRLDDVESNVRNEAGEIIHKKLDLFTFSKHPELADSETLREVEALMPQILREHMTDWLLCNFDTKGENFIITKKEGEARVLHGIDKEAAFNKILKDDAQMMSTTYKPHRNDTLYNVVFEKFAAGEMDFDLREVIPYVTRMETIGAQQYMQAFTPYIQYLRKKKGDDIADQTEEKIRARFLQLRAEYQRFFKELIERRCKVLHPEEAAGLRAKYYDGDGNFNFTAPPAE